MKMPRPTDDDRARFTALVPDGAGIEVKPMFGNLGAFVNGNMFMGLFGAQVGLKLDDGDRQALLGEDGAGPFGPAERPMGGYVTIPAAWRSKPAKAKPWVTKSMEYVASLPPKKSTAKKSAAKKR